MTTWTFYGTTVVFRLAQNINNIMFNGEWDQSYTNNTEEQVNLTVREIYLNFNFSLVVYPQTTSTWAVQNVVMLQGKENPSSTRKKDRLI
jgi:hypothetical protein